MLSKVSVTLQEYGDTVKDTMRARLQVCTSFLRLARAGDAAMLPYMQVCFLLSSKLIETNV